MKVSLCCMHLRRVEEPAPMRRQGLGGSICRYCRVSQHRWPGSRCSHLCRGTVLWAQLQERVLAPGGCYTADSAARAARVRQDPLEQPACHARPFVRIKAFKAEGPAPPQAAAPPHEWPPARSMEQTVQNGHAGQAHVLSRRALRVGHSNEGGAQLACTWRGTAQRSRA